MPVKRINGISATVRANVNAITHPHTPKDEHTYHSQSLLDSSVLTFLVVHKSGLVTIEHVSFDLKHCKNRIERIHRKKYRRNENTGNLKQGMNSFISDCWCNHKKKDDFTSAYSLDYSSLLHLWELFG